MELISAYLKKQEQQRLKAEQAKTESEQKDERPEIDLGEVIQYLKLDIDVMLRKNS